VSSLVGKTLDVTGLEGLGQEGLIEGRGRGARPTGIGQYGLGLVPRQRPIHGNFQSCFLYNLKKQNGRWRGAQGGGQGRHFNKLGFHVALQSLKL
jgi:hypothetical protein